MAEKCKKVKDKIPQKKGWGVLLKKIV